MSQELDQKITRFRRWWRHENYNREDMRRFREEYPDWNSMPDDVLAQTFAFQAFELRRRSEEFGGVLIDSFIRSYRDLQERVTRRYFSGEEE